MLRFADFVTDDLQKSTSGQIMKNISKLLSKALMHP